MRACARTGMFAFIYKHAIMFVSELMKEDKGRNDLMLLFLNFNFFFPLSVGSLNIINVKVWMR